MTNKRPGRPRTCYNLITMALIIPGPLIESISGSIGAVNFSEDYPSTALRSRIRKVRKTNAASTQARAAFARAARDWSTLSPALLDEWQSLAATNPRILGRPNRDSIPARSLFMYVNTVHERYAGAPQLSAPTKGYIYSGRLQLLEFKEGGPYTIRFTAVDDPTDTDVAIHILYPGRARLWTIQFFHFVCTTARTGNNQINLYPLWPADLSHPTTGTRIVLWRRHYKTDWIPSQRIHMGSAHVVT